MQKSKVQRLKRCESCSRLEVGGIFLSQETMKVIQSHELKEDATRGNLLYWRDGPKDKFTIRL